MTTVMRKNSKLQPRQSAVARQLTLSIYNRWGTYCYSKPSATLAAAASICTMGWNLQAVCCSAFCSANTRSGEEPGLTVYFICCVPMEGKYNAASTKVDISGSCLKKRQCCPFWATLCYNNWGGLWLQRRCFFVLKILLESYQNCDCPTTPHRRPRTIATTQRQSAKHVPGHK